MIAGHNGPKVWADLERTPCLTQWRYEFLNVRCELAVVRCLMYLLPW